jgi:aldose 1-epimerase
VSPAPDRPADDPALRPIRLQNANGLEAEVLPFGATLARLRAPDRDGRLGDVVLSLADVADYRGDHPHVGSTVGRYANRIGGARFALDGRTHVLAANDGPHHLHGGPHGLSRRPWRVLDRFAVPGGAGVALGIESPAGDDGYPGSVSITARYALGGDDALRIDYHATTDAPTVLSLAPHAYFHLDDGGASPVLDHELWLRASRYAPVDATGLPTGALEPVAGTPFDFTRPRPLGERIEALVPLRGGYDHPFALDAPGDLAEPAARLVAPRSGRVLTVSHHPALPPALHRQLPGRRPPLPRRRPPGPLARGLPRDPGLPERAQRAALPLGADRAGAGVPARDGVRVRDGSVWRSGKGCLTSDAWRAHRACEPRRSMLPHTPGGSGVRCTPSRHDSAGGGRHSDDAATIVVDPPGRGIMRLGCAARRQRDLKTAIPYSRAQPSLVPSACWASC